MVVFDYRGSFDSHKLLFNKYNQYLPTVSLVNWGKYDIPAVIDYIENLDRINNKDGVMSDLVFIAHSISGSKCFSGFVKMEILT